MIFDAFQRSCWDWALYNGSNANKGKKKKTRSPDLQEVHFYSPSERIWSVKIKQSVSLVTQMSIMGTTEVTTYWAPTVC